MRRMYWAVLPILAGLLAFASCSEKSPTSSRDNVDPTVRVIYPISTPENLLDISDSCDVYVAAKDNLNVTRVELWGMDLSQEDPQIIGEPHEDAIPLEGVPEDLRPTDGSQVYKWRWHTAMIRNGTEIRLFAKAYDGSGNVARSTPSEVRIINAQERHPPRPAVIVVDPANRRGQTGQRFLFDATATEDDVYTPDRVQVRWDVNNDGFWEYDWDRNLVATDQVSWSYNRTGTYSVVVEAKNDYLPGATARASVLIEVANIGGDPHPPEPANMLFVPAGIYFVGTDSVTQPFSNRDERPIHQTRLTSGYYIERTEVTNRLYLAFLKIKMNESPPQVVRERDPQLLREVLRYYPNKQEPVEEDSLPKLLLDPYFSAIYYDSFADSMAVNPDKGVLDDPVVGVTWYGAVAYAEYYGMRLPTEHEWEVAARGDSTSFIYPWGRTISIDQANFWDGGETRPRLRVRGSYPGWTSQFGLLDVVGNAAEWVKDWYYDTYPSTPQINPEGPVIGELKIVRGGSYRNTADGLRVTRRVAANPTQCSEAIGFRTAFTDTTSNP